MQDEVDNACEGAKTVIYCAGGSLPFGPGSYSAVGPGGVRTLCNVIKRYNLASNFDLYIHV